MPTQALFGGQASSGGGHHLQRFAEIEQFIRQAQLAHLAAGEIEHITNQPAQMLGAGINLFNVFAVEAALVLLRFLQQHFAQAHDQVQGCAQFMADHRKEAAFQAVGFFGQLASFGGFHI